ncbi:MAG: hypothetical protein M1818_005272 [Claussenomyces sp. TS43310]|nr:MAG: hypothetical protein M1818_005272 [Claussenomyces sp. TS43310]
MFSPKTYEGIAHVYAPRLVAFERTRDPKNTSKSVLLWISGLGDGLLTVEYPTSIATALPADWSLAQVLLSSSYTGWGTSSVHKDVAELATCVEYFRSIKSGKIVLMGHSTGSQDVIEYLSAPGQRPHVDGGILQAPVSDREALGFVMPAEVYEESVVIAKDMVAEGKGEEIVPTSVTQGVFGGVCCARRWLSLASPNHDGDDDFFSSDLTDEQLKQSFGSLSAKSPLCILYSENDEYVPPSVDKEALVERWIEIAQSGTGGVDEVNSGIVKGGTHDMKGAPNDSVQDLVSRVIGFLKTLEAPC